MSRGVQLYYYNYMNNNYKDVIIDTLKDYSAESADAKTLVHLIVETIVKAEMEGKPVKDNTYWGTLRAIEKDPHLLDLKKIEAQKTSKDKVSAVFDELLSYLRQYEVGIKELNEISDEIKVKL